jgi:hypothetical protein
MDQYPNITIIDYPIRWWFGGGGNLVDRIREAAEGTGEERGAPDIIYVQTDYLASLGE